MESHTKLKGFASLISEMFSEKIPFNRFLGLKVESMGSGGVKTSFEMRHEFMGDYERGMLHGGIISSVIDATGGLAAFVSTMEKIQVKTFEEIVRRSFSLSTIDMRVDFLRPGIGKSFAVTAYTLRTGKKLVVTRSELHNEHDDLIAVGTGSYLVIP